MEVKRYSLELATILPGQFPNGLVWFGYNGSPICGCVVLGGIQGDGATGSEGIVCFDVARDGDHANCAAEAAKPVGRSYIHGAVASA